MILRRLALFVGLAFAFLAAQVPEYVQQYRQRLGGAIDELASVVSRFDSDSAQQGLTEAAGIDRLRSNADLLARQRGEAIADDARRLQMLRDAQARFRTDGPVARIGTLVTHYDGQVGRGAFAEFRPAVPTTPEGFALGLFGFVLGGGAAHMAGRSLRQRPREAPAT